MNCFFSALILISLLTSCNSSSHHNSKVAESYHRHFEDVERDFAQKVQGIRLKDKPVLSMFTAYLQKETFDSSKPMVLSVYINDIVYTDPNEEAILYAKASFSNPSCHALQLLIRCPLPRHHVEEFEKKIASLKEKPEAERYRVLAIQPTKIEKIPSTCGEEKYLEWEQSFRLIIDGTFVDWSSFPEMASSLLTPI